MTTETEELAALNARATQGELSVFGSTIESDRLYLGTDAWAIARSEIGATKRADFELYAALVNLYRSGQLVLLENAAEALTLIRGVHDALEADGSHRLLREACAGFLAKSERGL